MNEQEWKEYRWYLEDFCKNCGSSDCTCGSTVHLSQEEIDESLKEKPPTNKVQ